ncbi:ABC transporter, substrate-binding protein [Bacillus sp. JCM 19045]|nr:ABC transporter, substrate-binding protein [Bacillus sp. JCM 19045]
MSAQGYYGSFDVGIEEDGQDYVVVEPPEGTSEDEWKWTNSLVDHGLMYVPDELDARIIAPPTVAERLEQNDELLDYFPADEQILPPLKFTAEEDNELSILYSDLNNLVSRKWSEWVTQGGVEDEWDAYIEELNRIGLERYSEIYQGSLDR